MKKRIICFALLLCMLLPLSSCVMDQKYDYDMTKYVTIPTITGTEITVNLEQVQMTIDADLTSLATEKILALAGDNVEVFISIQEYKEIGVDSEGNKIDQIGELWYSTDNAETTDKKENILINNLGAATFFDEIEKRIIKSTLGQTTTENDFYIPQDIEAMTALKNNYPEVYNALVPHAGKRAYLTYGFISRPAREGDVVSVTYTGYQTDDFGNILVIDGKEQTFEGGSGTSKVYIGSRTFITDFEKGLVGLTIGNQGQFKATFPSDYGVESLNGKTVIFKATINSIYQVPEYNIEFVKEIYGEQYESTEAFEKAIIDSYAAQQVISYLVSNTVVLKYPKKEFKLIKKQLEDAESAIQSQYSMTLEQYVQASGYATLDDYIHYVMKAEMAYYAYAQARGLVVTEEHIEAARQALITTYTNQYMQNNSSLTEQSAKAYAEQYIEENITEADLYQEALYTVVGQDIVTQYKLVTVPAPFVSVTKGGSLFD